jgi:hypothetical protein
MIPWHEKSGHTTQILGTHRRRGRRVFLRSLVVNRPLSRVQPGPGQAPERVHPLRRFRGWMHGAMRSGCLEGAQAALRRWDQGSRWHRSMGTPPLLVIAKVEFDHLQPGMTVAYQNVRGRRVVHQLLESTSSGWRVQGLNNETADRERVTRENLIGVVYASLASDPSDD